MNLRSAPVIGPAVNTLHGRFKFLLEKIVELFNYRALIEILVIRELKARYRGTVLGFLWSFVNPIVLMSIYVLVFSIYFRFEMEHYAVFLLCGILAWQWFTSSLNEGMQSLIANGGLIKKVYLPSEIFPMVSIIANMIHYVLSIPVLLSFMLLFGIMPTWTLIYLPIVLLVQFLLTYGLTLFLSAWVVQFRDLTYILPNLLMIFFFLTPILYPITQIPEEYRSYVYMNPLTHLFEIHRAVLFHRQPPPSESVLSLLVLGLALVGAGLAYFDSRKDLFAESV